MIKVHIIQEDPLPQINIWCGNLHALPRVGDELRWKNRFWHVNRIVWCLDEWEDVSGNQRANIGVTKIP